MQSLVNPYHQFKISFGKGVGMKFSVSTKVFVFSSSSSAKFALRIW